MAKDRKTTLRKNRQDGLFTLWEPEGVDLHVIGAWDPVGAEYLLEPTFEPRAFDIGLLSWLFVRLERSPNGARVKNNFRAVFIGSDRRISYACTRPEFRSVIVESFLCVNGLSKGNYNHSKTARGKNGRATFTTSTIKPSRVANAASSPM
jgi:hypothetical protein